MLKVLIAVVVAGLVGNVLINWLFVNLWASVGTLGLIAAAAMLYFRSRVKSHYIATAGLVGMAFLAVGISKQSDVVAAKEAAIAMVKAKEAEAEKANVRKAELAAEAERKEAALAQIESERKERIALDAAKYEMSEVGRSECSKSIHRAQEKGRFSDGVDNWGAAAFTCQVYAGLKPD